MNPLVLHDDPDKRFITCYYAYDKDKKLTKYVKVFSADYRQRVVNYLIGLYNLEYIYKEDEIYDEINVPHLKYCREMNTDRDNYSWYNEISRGNIIRDVLLELESKYDMENG